MFAFCLEPYDCSENGHCYLLYTDGLSGRLGVLAMKSKPELSCRRELCPVLCLLQGLTV